MNVTNGLQRVGKESGRFYQISGGSAFLLTEVPCAGKEVEARMVFDGPGQPRPDIPPYECAYCHKPIVARERHWSGTDRRHLTCPVATRSPNLTDARVLQLYPGVSAIRRMRAADELNRYRENKTARHGVAQGATFLRDALAGKFKDLTGTVDAEAVRAMLTSSFVETEAVAESLMIQAVEAYESEGEDITDEGTAAHAAIARFFESKTLPDDERWSRSCLTLAAWLKSQFGLEDTEGRLMPVWCEVPCISPHDGYGGTLDWIAVTDRAIVLLDHKTRVFADTRRRLAAMKSNPPLHFRPWMSETMQQAAYRRMLMDSTAVIGQTDRHTSLRKALSDGKPVESFQHYIDRETGETYMLDWGVDHLPWQRPGQTIHDGLDHGWYVFRCLLMLWMAENYTPSAITGHDALGRPYPGEISAMAAIEKERLTLP